MSKNKIKSVLIASLSVFVAVLLLGYAAYGWMSMSKNVSANGMKMTVTAPDNLQISLSENEGYGNSIVVDMKSLVKSATVGDDVQFHSETDSFSLLPASSYEGKNLWYAKSSNINGVATCNENEFHRAGRVSYNENNNSFEGYYVDVPLYIRTQSAEYLTIGIYKTSTSIASANDDEGVKGIVRMAFLNSDASDISFSTNSGAYASSLVYADTANANTSKVVTDNSGVSKFTDPYYLTFTDNISDQTICSLLKSTTDGSGNTVYHPTKITVRIWIEGQDASCVASKLSDDRNFNINLGFIIK